MKKSDCNSTPAPDLSFESNFRAGHVCGVDEVGRGPWAGPIVAGAVILDPAHIPVGIRDSKQLSKPKREALAMAIQAVARCGIGIVEVPELDAVGLTEANDLSMRRAIAALACPVDHALVDGKRLPRDLPCAATTIIKGDSISLSIAAASIIAKVHRDATMAALALEYPGYGWETNAGYGVAHHRAAIASLGITPHHRRSFAPIAKILHEVNAVES